MGMESERKELLRRLKKDGRQNYKAFAKKMRFPYTTLILLIRDGSPGTVRSWQKIERYYQKQDIAVSSKKSMTSTAP